MIETKWFAVCTRSGWEKRVAESLAKKKIEFYWPVNRSQKELSERKKAFCEPLFTAYVFVNLSEAQKAPVLQIPGVINYVYWLGQPAVIRNEEIASIRQFLNEYPQARLEKTKVNVQDEVRYITDPLITRKGNLLEVRNTAAKVVLPSLGYTIVSDDRKEYSEEVNTIKEEPFKVRM